MTAKVYDLRIYPGVSSGFDIIARVRGGIMKLGNHPAMDVALEAARAVEGRKTGQPIYVYDRSFAALFAEGMAPAVEGLMNGARK